MRKNGWIVLLTTALLVLAVPVNAQTATPEPSTNPLIKMLALIPDNADTRAKIEGVSYADYQALKTLQGIPAGKLDENTRRMYFRALRRLAAGLDLSYFSAYVDSSVRLVGFYWLDVNQGISVGSPPRIATLISGTFESAAIGEALKVRDFEQSTVDGITLWHRFEDAQVNVSAREPGDPFGGNLGLAARIVLLPGYIANSRYTDFAKQFIDTYNRKQRSLAEADDYRVLTSAITDPKIYSGSLIQAQFMTSDAFAGAVPPKGSNIDVSTYGNLPPYRLAVLADRQEGDSQVNVIALFYPDADTAQKASVELGKRIAGFDVSHMYEQSNVTVDEPRVFTDRTGMAAAIVSIHYGLPPATTNSGNGLTPSAGMIYQRWINLWLARFFTPLSLTLSKS